MSDTPGGNPEPAAPANPLTDADPTAVDPQPAASPGGEAPPEIQHDPFTPDFSVFPEEERHIHEEWFEEARKEMAAGFMQAHNQKWEQMATERKQHEEAVARMSQFLPVVEAIEQDAGFKQHMFSAVQNYYGQPAPDAADPLTNQPTAPGSALDIEPEALAVLNEWGAEWAKSMGFVTQEEIKPALSYAYQGMQKAETADLRKTLDGQGLAGVFDELNAAPTGGKSPIQAEMDRQHAMGNFPTRDEVFWNLAGKGGHLQKAYSEVAVTVRDDKLAATVLDAGAPGARGAGEVDLTGLSAKEMEEILPKAEGAEDVDIY